MPIGVMMVEDDSEIAGRVTRDWFGSATRIELRHRVATIESATELLASEPVDCVLLDLDLPGGNEMLRRVRSAFEGPIVVMGSDPSEELATTAVTEGAQDYLVKQKADGDRVHRAILSAVERWVHEQRAAQLARAKDQFLETISHELRTPLTPLVGFARILQNSRDMPDWERAELLALMVDQAEHIQSLVEDLLVAARIDTGGILVERSRVDLTAAAARAVRLKNGRARLERCSPMVLVTADGLRVAQIIRNLLSNAVRFGGTNVVVTTGEVDTVGYVEVSDDGPGIDPDHVDRVFMPYETLGPSRAPGSLGLGLPIARHLAEAMSGALIYARREGWSVFRLELALATRPRPEIWPVR
jgi:signal transduction histidine kinase